MKFESNDIICYHGLFPDMMLYLKFKVLRTIDDYYLVAPFGNFRIEADKNKIQPIELMTIEQQGIDDTNEKKGSEWLKKSYIESCYSIDKTYLRKKKLLKLNK